MKRFQFIASLFGMGGVVKAAPLVKKSPSKKIFVTGYVTKPSWSEVPYWQFRFQEVGQRGTVSDRIHLIPAERKCIEDTIKVTRKFELGGIGAYSPALNKVLTQILQENIQTGLTEIYEI